MKKILKTLLCFILICTSFICVSCSNKNDDNENGENVANKEYYLNLGYHSVTFDNYVTVSSESENKIVVSSTEIMVPNNSDISLEFNLSKNSSFEFSNGNYVNFSEGLILSGFEVGEKFYEVNNATLKVKEDITISAKLNKFKTVGIAVYAIDNLSTSPEIPSGKMDNISIVNENPLYFYANSVSASGFNESNINTNTELSTSVTLLEDNKFSAQIFMAIYEETLAVKINLILSDEESNIYLFEFEYDGAFWNTPITIENLDNKNSNLSSLTLILGNDINNEYERL